jgi:hypothetical protein
MLHKAKKAKRLGAALVVLTGAGMLAGCSEVLGLGVAVSIVQAGRADAAKVSAVAETMGKEVATYWTDAHAGSVGGDLEVVVVDGEYHLLSAENPKASDYTLVGPATPGVTINISGTSPKDWCVEAFNANHAYWLSASTYMAEGLCP